MNAHSFFSWLRHSPIPRLTVATLAAMTWSSIAVCGQIHDAAHRGDLENIKALLKDKPDLVSSRDDNGATPLHWAAIIGHKDLVKLLLANKADVNAKDNSGKTPLILAASRGYGGFFGAFQGRKDVAGLLLASGAAVNAKAKDGETPLSAAFDSGLKDVAELLLANKADINVKTTKGETLLREAARGGTKDLVELLLANKVDVNAKTADGCTPLYEAVLQGHKDVTELLLAKGADVNAKNNNGDSPLHCAASFPKRKEVAELLLANKADVNAKNNKGQMPLHIAAFRGIEDVAELLLANKADVHAKDNNGEAPLHYAASGANGWNGSYTEEHIGVLKLLLTNKADVNAKDNNGETPLHIAVANGRKDSAEWLRLRGGQDETGRKPLANLKGLTGFKLPNGTLLITSGFPYDKEREILNGYAISVGNSGDVEKLLFDQVLVQEQLSPDGKLVSRLANSVVGISWCFKNARTSFRVGNYVYTALREGSTVTFTKEGVVMAGFQITPLSKYKKR